MLALINDLLDISKLESGSIHLDKTLVDFNLLVDLLNREFRIPSKKKEVSIIIDIEDGLPHILVDVNKIGQVISNLLDNSLKFVSFGGEIKVYAIRWKNNGLDPNDDREFVRVSIWDNGIGIPLGEIQLIFDRYKQASSARKIKQKGTGLGLALSKLLVEAHGGKIWCESELGSYTVFHFTIPLK